MYVPSLTGWWRNKKPAVNCDAIIDLYLQADCKHANKRKRSGLQP